MISLKRCLKVFSLLIMILVVGCGGGGAPGGGDASNNTSSQKIDEMTAVTDSAATYFKNTVDSGVSINVATAKTIDWLKAQDGITDAYLDTDQKNIFVNDVTGITTVIITDNYIYNPSVSDLSRSLHSTLQPKTAALQQNNINSIILDPYKLNLPNINTVHSVLSGYVGNNIKLLDGNNVTLDIFTKLSTYDIIYYLGHGGVNPNTGGVAIGTGELFTKDKLDAYSLNIENMGIPVWTEGDGNQYFFKFKVPLQPTTFGISDKFINLLTKDLKASIVYIDACNSMSTDTMAKAFTSNGVKTYFGWDNSVSSFFLDTDKYPKSLFEDLFAGNDVQTAYNKMSFSFLNFATLRYYGSGSTKLPANVTSTQLSTPTISSPAPNAILTNYPRTAYLSWSNVSGATSYEIEFYWSSTMPGTVPNYEYAETFVSSTNYYTTQALVGDNPFSFRVRAKNSSTTGEWSNYRYFSYKTQSNFEPFIGQWANVNVNTDSITYVEIKREIDNLNVHMWGQCHPYDCDWGSEFTSIEDSEDGALSLIWVESFAKRYQQLSVLQDGRLKVSMQTHFTDTSGRPDYTSVDYFSKY